MVRCEIRDPIGMDGWCAVLWFVGTYTHTHAHVAVALHYVFPFLRLVSRRQDADQRVSPAFGQSLMFYTKHYTYIHSRCPKS